MPRLETYSITAKTAVWRVMANAWHCGSPRGPKNGLSSTPKVNAKIATVVAKQKLTAVCPPRVLRNPLHTQASIVASSKMPEKKLTYLESYIIAGLSLLARTSGAAPCVPYKVQGCRTRFVGDGKKVRDAM